MPLADAVPELASEIDRWRPTSGGPVDFDRASAAHYQALVHEIFPFQGVFLGDDAMPGGPETDRVAAFFSRIGFRVDPTGPTPDHVSWLLEAMAFLCGAEADARVDARTEVVAAIEQMQIELLDAHLLWWWPALAEALHNGDFPFYRMWAERVTELLHHHRSDLPSSDEAANLLAEAEPVASSAWATLLAADETGLGDIADLLLTPIRGGAFLSRQAVRSVGREDRLPGGFGARRTVLVNTFKSGATYGALGPLIGRLRARFVTARRFYTDYADRAPPAAAARARRWAVRCSATEEGLRTIDSVVESRLS